MALEMGDVSGLPCRGYGLEAGAGKADAGPTHRGMAFKVGGAPWLPWRGYGLEAGGEERWSVYWQSRRGAATPRHGL